MLPGASPYWTKNSPTLVGHAAVYSSTVNTLFLFGGTTDAESSIFSTAAYGLVNMGQGWATLDIHPDMTAVFSATAVFAEATSNLYVFGGHSELGTTNDLWQLDCTDPQWWNWSWEAPTQGGHSMPEMFGHSAAFQQDATGAGFGAMYVFYQSTLYQWVEQGDWSQVTVVGSPVVSRTYAVLVYSNIFGGLLLYGGLDENGAAMNDLYTLDVTTWPQQPATCSQLFVNSDSLVENQPPQINFALGAALDPDGGLYIFGGWTSTCSLSDTLYYFGAPPASLAATAMRDIGVESTVCAKFNHPACCTFAHHGQNCLYKFYWVERLDSSLDLHSLTIL